MKEDSGELVVLNEHYIFASPRVCVCVCACVRACVHVCVQCVYGLFLFVSQNDL